MNNHQNKSDTNRLIFKIIVGVLVLSMILAIIKNSGQDQSMQRDLGLNKANAMQFRVKVCHWTARQIKNIFLARDNKIPLAALYVQYDKRMKEIVTNPSIMANQMTNLDPKVKVSGKYLKRMVNTKMLEERVGFIKKLTAEIYKSKLLYKTYKDKIYSDCMNKKGVFLNPRS